MRLSNWSLSPSVLSHQGLVLLRAPSQGGDQGHQLVGTLAPALMEAHLFVPLPIGHRPVLHVGGVLRLASLSRAVDKEGYTIDFLLTPQRDQEAAEACLRKAIRNQLLPEKLTIDQSGANTAAIKPDNRTHKTAIVIRHSKYLNNIVAAEQFSALAA